MEYVTLLASVPAIIALVNFFKRVLKLGGEAPLVLAVVIGVAVNVANLYLGDLAVYQAAVTGLMLGLAAAGLYDLRGGSPE